MSMGFMSSEDVAKLFLNSNVREHSTIIDLAFENILHLAEKW